MTLTTDPTHQLDDLLGTAIAGFDIPDPLYELAVRRYSDVGVCLSRHWAESPASGLIYPQGSFRLGTVVQPINAAGEYDIDLVCRRDILKQSTSQRALKLDVGAGLDWYVDRTPDGSPRKSDGNRCWTLDYPHEPFHMDVLPAIPNRDPGFSPHAILLTDKELRAWQHSNPIGYANWFHTRMRPELEVRLAALAKRMEIADVPEWQIKTTLQRAVQALKRHRDLYFADRPDDRPASIIITTLAAMAYASGGSLYEVLIDVVSKMAGFIDRRNGVWWVENPVDENENFADRWRSHPERADHFFTWLERVEADFRGYGEERGVDTVLQKVARTFGERPAERAAEAAGVALRHACEAGAVGIAAGTGLLTTAPRRSAPNHTFHGGTPPNSRS